MNRKKLKPVQRLQSIGQIALLVFFTVLTTQNFAQSGIPAGSCGIEYVYDDAGNMVERHYVCNNSASALKSANVFEGTDAQRAYISANTIYPNPTTGRFQIKMSNQLQNAKVEIINSQGATIIRKNMSGSLLEFDLSGKPSGIYFIKIFDKTDVCSMQIILQ